VTIFCLRPVLTDGRNGKHVLSAHNRQASDIVKTVFPE